MMTVDHMREAWAYALAEVDAAISFIEVEKFGDENAAKDAAYRWLITLQRDQVEYRALLMEHPTVRSKELTH